MARRSLHAFAAAAESNSSKAIIRGAGMLGAALCTILFSCNPTRADVVADFYRGKTLSIVVGYTAASGYTILTRLLAPAIAKRIPGTPTVVVKTMPGAGSLKATGYLYRVAPKDGSVIGVIGRTVPLLPLVDSAAANFDPLKFNWLGSASKNVMIGASWHTSPVKTMEDARRHELIVGAPSAHSEAALIPKLYNATIGTKFKVVTGYPQPQIAVAMERGELQGQMQWSLDALLATHSDWIKEHKINLLAQTGYEPDPRLPDLPLAINFARSPADRQLIELIFDAYEAARLYVAPPGVPPDRLNALRKAFMAAVYDKDFLAAAAKAKIDVFKPAPADRVIALIRKAYAAPRSVIDRAKSLFN